MQLALLLALMMGARAAEELKPEMVPELGQGAEDGLLEEVAVGRSLLQAPSFRSYRWMEARRPFNKYEEAARWAVTTINRYPDVLGRIYGRNFDRRYMASYYRLEKAYYYRAQADDYYYYLRVTHTYRNKRYTYDYVVYWPDEFIEGSEPYYTVYRIVYGRQVWDGQWPR